MFKYQILIHPLGTMYGSAGAFLSPENLVGRSGAKFPPDAATLAGLFFSAHYNSKEEKKDLRENLYVAGPFWAERRTPRKVYVPIPWSLIITRQESDRWCVAYPDGKDREPQWQRDRDSDIEPEYTWQPIDTWNHDSINRIRKDAKKSPWRYSPILHPSLQEEQRTVRQKDGLFLENAVQMNPDVCLVYLSTHPLKPGWYRFGGENHVVEIDCIELEGAFLKLLQKRIQRAFALITPAVWGSNRFSYRYPQTWEFGKPQLMLTDKPVPYRYRTSGTLGRGRYAIPAGSVYVLRKPVNKSWWEWSQDYETWFPKEGFYLSHVGCGLCLPIDIPGLSDEQGVA